MSEDRSKIFSVKAEEMQVSLEQWARENKLLSPDEIMEVSLTITIRHRPPVQYTFSEEIPLEEVSPHSLVALDRTGGRLLRPAILTQSEVDILLARLRGEAHKSLVRFFQDSRWGNRVGPMPRIHKACEEPIDGKYYRLMKLKSGTVQFWEVLPKPE